MILLCFSSLPDKNDNISLSYVCNFRFCILEARLPNKICVCNILLNKAKQKNGIGFYFYGTFESIFDQQSISVSDIKDAKTFSIDIINQKIMEK